MITDFFPIPEIGCRYKSKSGDFYIIKDVQTDLGSIPDYVEFVSESAPDGPTIEYTAEDWNALDAVKVMSEPISDPQPQLSPNPQPQPALDPEPEPEPEPTPSDGIYSSDPRINELAKLLQDGPKKFNQEFYPIDKTLSDNNMVEHDVEDAFQKTLDEIDALRDQGAYIDEPFIDDVDEEGNPVKKPNPNRRKRRCGCINEFLWICGGLDRSLLRMCPTDWAKKAGMGGTILGTAFLAFLSMTYAAFTVASIGAQSGSKSPLLLALAIGAIWGLVIFNLDRYLVNSMFSDGKPGISRQEFKSGLPRIIIAIILGIVISTPIEMKIFDGNINKIIMADNEGRMTDESLLSISPELRELQAQLENQREETEIFKQRWLNIDSLYTIEHTKGMNGSVAGYGPKAQKLEGDKKDAEGKYNDAKKVLDSLQNKYNVEKHNVTGTQEGNVSKMQGFSRRLEALFQITSFKNEKKSLAWVRIFIMLMFIVLEVLPVLNKMMQTDGKYDKLINLESDTMDLLARAKAFNSINVLRSGNLAMYRNQIIFGKVPGGKDKDFKGIIDEDSESKTPFAKTDYKKDSRNETDADNYEIYRYAREVCTKYVKGRIDKLFAGCLPQSDRDDFKTQDVSSIEPDKGQMTSSDPSNDAIKI